MVPFCVQGADRAVPSLQQLSGLEGFAIVRQAGLKFLLAKGSQDELCRKPCYYTRS